MAEENFSFKQYGIFSDGVATTQALNNSWNEGQTSLDGYKATISGGSIFMGPAADSAVEGFGKVASKIGSEVTNFQTMYNFLIQSAQDYSSSDKKADATVLNADDSGKLVASTLQHTVVGGQPVYYNQNGYYDKDGKWRKWESKWAKDIASSGCGPTSMAAVLATMFGDTSITPSTVADNMSYDDNIGGSYVKKTADIYGLDQTHKIGLNKEKMDTFLRNNGKMIVAVNQGGHYIAVLGINDSTNPPTYIVCDPNDSKTAQKTWTYNDIAAGHTMVFHIAPKGKTVEQCLQGTGTAVQV